MDIVKIQSYLVEPGKGMKNPPPIFGLEIPKSGGLFDLLVKIYDKAESECNINIAFNMDKDGTQNNEVHSMFVDFSKEPENFKGQPIAERLCRVTTGRSGLGLLFLMLARQDQNIKLVVSRFPAERGILAETDNLMLRLELIERIFMKNPKYYKAALQSFLNSNYKTTSKEGSRQFANAVLRASQTAKDLSTKQKLASLATLVSGLDGKTVSINDIIKKYTLSPEVEYELLKNLPYPEYADTKFTFDSGEFTSNAPYSCVELDNEAMMIAPSNTFDDVFVRELIEQINQTKDLYRFSTKGQIQREQLRGRK